MRAATVMLASMSLLPLLGASLGCQPAEGESSSSTWTPTTAPLTSSGEGTSGGTATTSATGTGTGSSASSTGEVSTTEDSGASSGGTLLLDVGVVKDVGDSKPPGCKGKIDFLFVISRWYGMKPHQEKLLAAFPKFISTIESKFADFDFHIMVVDGDEDWGVQACTDDCPVLDCKVGQACCPTSVCPNCMPPKNVGDICCDIPDYPCDLLDKVTSCDQTMGSGNVFAAGKSASNKPCAIAGGRRYLTKDQPNLSETFSCIARLGIYGYGLLGEALTAAMQPGINAPGGCNAGFLRKDALLMVTFIGGYDYDSKWEPHDWAHAVLEAKKGDAGAVVMLDILDPKCPEPYDRICQLVKMFPYHLISDIKQADYAAAFDEAADLVEVACAELVPG